MPVYMVDTPVADDFSMSSYSHSDTESLLSQTSFISISSGYGVRHTFSAPRGTILDSIVCLWPVEWLGTDSLAGQLVSLRRHISVHCMGSPSARFGLRCLRLLEHQRYKVGNHRHSTTVVRYSCGLGSVGSRPEAAFTGGWRLLLHRLRWLEMSSIGVVIIEYLGIFR